MPRTARFRKSRKPTRRVVRRRFKRAVRKSRIPRTLHGVNTHNFHDKKSSLTYWLGNAAAPQLWPATGPVVNGTTFAPGSSTVDSLIAICPTLGDSPMFVGLATTYMYCKFNKFKFSFRPNQVLYTGSVTSTPGAGNPNVNAGIAVNSAVSFNAYPLITSQDSSSSTNCMFQTYNFLLEDTRSKKHLQRRGVTKTFKPKLVNPIGTSAQTPGSDSVCYMYKTFPKLPLVVANQGSTSVGGGDLNAYGCLVYFQSLAEATGMSFDIDSEFWFTLYQPY